MAPLITSLRASTRSLLSILSQPSRPLNAQTVRTALSHARFYSIKKKSEPLHILFCGSDEFSCASLRALHEEHVRNPDLIRSISVVVRPGKSTGRGMKVIHDPPVRALATSLKLPIHQRDTFIGWDMPPPINLIIAVSFGLFVPPRLLRRARYGGLNIHPSLLPDLRGPAPLQHALLADYSITGVSLQTLDSKAFDHGVVLAQTPSNPDEEGALTIPREVTSVEALLNHITPAATKLLIQGLRDNVHVQPHQDRGWKPDSSVVLRHAPKITKADKQVTLDLLQRIDSESTKEGGGMLARRQAAIGPLWFYSRTRRGQVKRILIHKIEYVPTTTKGSAPPMLAKSKTNSKRKTYAIPLLETEKQTEGIAKLVFYDRDDDAPVRVPRQPSKGNGSDALYLGDYCVSRLKVEGEHVKDAWLAIHQFLIDE